MLGRSFGLAAELLVVEATADSAGEQLIRARGGAEEVEGKVNRLWACGIVAERRGVAGAAPAALLGALSPSSRRAKKVEKEQLGFRERIRTASA